MILQHASNELRDVRNWINDGSSIPDWVRTQMSGDLASNGTFLIATPVGTTRVHPGDIVVEHQGQLWSRSPDEIPQLVNGFGAEAAMPIAAIGPGKDAQFGTKSKARKGRWRGGERKTGFRSPIGKPPSIEWLHTTELTVDQSYQRSIDNEGSRRLIASIAANFDWRLCAPLVVSRRPEGLKVIIDGQHRWAAAVRRGDLPHLPCCLFTYDSPEDEARMFIVANRARKPMNRLDDFHAALAAADEDAIEIQRLVTEAGLRMARNTSSTAWKAGEVAFTSSIATALRRHGPAIVSAALTSIAEAYEARPLTYGASIFGALIKLFANPPKGFDPDDLIPTLRRFDMALLGEIVKGLSGGDSRAVAVHAAILESLSHLKQAESAA
ncbi:MULTISPECIES: DUF6551 family protein [unclassified Mesorhizobium]|uniref:DUF6551 family protein n=1 Tax=unclassified Mesorhizobium TaxID=325217 RepID=UPI001CCD06CD|nr:MULTISPECIES: DUF6551 family protein [unclassified Mesorhizobium]MBZ9743573.1 ParB N-terminal domain-containing protein [Mesorhizobium sp. CO1-1-4]MBZ9806234.1 ParB N-terminal domain-containing protein [Mesorhizobium sp. ES1-6]